MNNLYQQFEIINKRLFILRDYQQMLEKIQADFSSTSSVADKLGLSIVVLNSKLLVDNIVLNACNEKLAKDIAGTAANEFKGAVLRPAKNCLSMNIQM